MPFRIIARLTLLVTFLATMTGAIVGQGLSYAQTSAADRSAAQETWQVYLPLVSAPGPSSDPGTDPYTQLRSRAAQACPLIGLDQLCYVGGPVSAQTAAGTLSLTTPGTTIDLATLQRLSLSAPTPDSASWGVVRMRLRSGADLDLIAFGSLDLRVVALANGPLGMPSLALHTSPTPSSSARYSSGLVASTLAHEPSTLAINGATVSLAGSVFLSTSPATQAAQLAADDDLLVPLTVAVADGVAHVAAAGSDHVAAQGQQIQVSPDPSGQVAGPPSTPIDVLVHEYVFNLVVPMDSETRAQLADAIIGRLETAIDRCVAGRVGAVYSVVFWNRTIGGISYLEEAIGFIRLADANARVPDCLSFEIEFDSGATTQGGPITETSHLRATRLPISFNAVGNLRGGGRSPLTYVSHSFVTPAPCEISTVTLDGGLSVEASSLRLSVNQVRFDIRLGVIKHPSSIVTMYCPPADPINVSIDQWLQVFPHMHRDIWQPGQPHLFRFNDWRYTAGTAVCDGTSSATCAHVGEAIYQRAETSGGITFSTDTHLILVHTPIR